MIVEKPVIVEKAVVPEDLLVLCPLPVYPEGATRAELYRALGEAIKSIHGCNLVKASHAAESARP